MTQGQLQTALLALLPKTGERRSAAGMAQMAGVTEQEVVEALQAQTIDHRVQHDPVEGVFWLRKAGA